MRMRNTGGAGTTFIDIEDGQRFYFCGMLYVREGPLRGRCVWDGEVHCFSTDDEVEFLAEEDGSDGENT